jgi:hypothetical protein
MVLEEIHILGSYFCLNDSMSSGGLVDEYRPGQGKNVFYTTLRNYEAIGNASPSRNNNMMKS